MIAADTSAWIDYAKGVDSAQALHLESALTDGTLVIPLPVFFEILSGPGLTKEARQYILQLPKLETVAGFWERAGTLWGVLLKKGLKARAMDCLIAQSCMDHDIGLIATDQDFRHFIKQGLKLI